MEQREVAKLRGPVSRPLQGETERATCAAALALPGSGTATAEAAVRRTPLTLGAAEWAAEVRHGAPVAACGLRQRQHASRLPSQPHG